MQCRKCALRQGCTHVVFGEGARHAKIMCIGEGPGYYEDQLGRPFVGASGQLLDKILSVCGFSRLQQVFIGNIVKCRPPQNRDPLPEEREACLPYILKQIELIDPPIIILLGGTWLNWNNRLVMPTFHPSALLRNPALKRDAWEDFKKVIDKYRELVDPQHHSDYH